MLFANKKWVFVNQTFEIMAVEERGVVCINGDLPAKLIREFLRVVGIDEGCLET